jgi:N-acetylmuramoyl-L-alanine amidase
MKSLEAKNQPAKLRDLVIAIDAGHGGEDPGARGKKGTREKDVVLSIARRLAALVDKEPGMRAVLVRRGDYYIGLRKRMEIARKNRADLFISIHADAFKDRRVQGASVYAVSRRGASSEMARWLAARENAADLVGGVSLDDKDDLLAEVLLDLAQTATLEASNEVAGNVLTEMKRIGRVHKRSVQHAGFVVLKSPDIPSLLVETAFISNPSEENRLRSGKHQQKVAAAILGGVRRYFADNPPPGSLVAKNSPRRHVIRRGDTLSQLAQRYGVSMASLRRHNRLRDDNLLVGAVLTIPGG